jgi:hypothetical protein
MAVCRNQAEEFVRKAMSQDRHRDFLRRVDLVYAFERFGIARPLDAIDMWLQTPTIKPMNTLGRHQGTFGIGQLGVSGGEKVGKDRHQIKTHHHNASRHGEVMLAKPPPHQLPL